MSGMSVVVSRLHSGCFPFLISLRRVDSSFFSRFPKAYLLAARSLSFGLQKTVFCKLKAYLLLCVL